MPTFNLSLVILALVLLLITLRQTFRIPLRIWHIMLGGAVAVLVTGQITPLRALKAINLDVMLFLFGMFVVGVAMEESGYLMDLSYKIFGKVRTVNQLIFKILFVMGFFSALLMNDTLAIVGTPLVLYFASKHKISSELLLLALAFSITIGSVMSPIGNPQNLLIALESKLSNPFVTFLQYLFLPTLINLLAAYLLLRIFYRKEFHKTHLVHIPEAIKDQKLYFWSKISLSLILLLVMVKIAGYFIFLPFQIYLTYIALLGALPILLFSSQGLKLIKQVDWPTLIFFAAMFVLMESVWVSGFFQELMERLHLDVKSLPLILTLSVILSQLISNVPFVALYLPLLLHIDSSPRMMAALAAGSTLAGNLLLFGAASNVIITQQAEKKGTTLSFWRFALVGIPLTIINVLVCWLWLWLF